MNPCELVLDEDGGYYCETHEVKAVYEPTTYYFRCPARRGGDSSVQKRLEVKG